MAFQQPTTAATSGGPGANGLDLSHALGDEEGEQQLPAKRKRNLLFSVKDVMRATEGEAAGWGVGCLLCAARKGAQQSCTPHPVAAAVNRSIGWTQPAHNPISPVLGHLPESCRRSPGLGYTAPQHSSSTAQQQLPNITTPAAAQP
jgi:hypothetical protein